MAFRSLNQHRLSAVINVTGLAIGMASCLLITFYIQEETSYDKFYDNSEQVYRLNTYWKQEESDEKFATTPPPLGPMLATLSPDIEAITRLYKGGDFTMRPDHDFERPYRETNAWIVDKDFLKVLDNGVISGDAETMLLQPRSVVMPKATALRYFGQEAFDQGNIVGRSLGGGGDGGTKWLVTGVIENQPEQSHFQFDMLLSSAGETSFEMPNWGWLSFYTYIKVKDDSPESLSSINDQLEYIIANHTAQNFGVSIDKLRDSGLDMRYSMQPLEDIHLKSALLKEMRPNGNVTYVRSMIIVAIFIVILACVNFVNLTTARSAVRAKEIGVRKVLGSHRSQLIFQFLTESLLMTFMALLIAFGLVEFLTVLLSANFDWSITTSYIRQPGVLLVVFGAAAALGLLAGVYPALYLTKFQPSQVLKGKLTSGRSEKRVRNLLVTFQFIISISLIISTLIINSQVAYIQNKDLGFNKENVLVIQNDREIDERRAEFKTLLKQNASILDVSFSTGLPGLPQYMRRDFTIDGRNDNMGLDWFQIDDSFLSTLDIELIEGRAFSNEFASDTSAILINQTAIVELGLENPIGTRMTINKGDNDERSVHIIGIIEDFNLQSFDRKIGPLALEYLNDFNFKDYITVRLAPGLLSDQIELVNESWSELEPNVPMVHSFLDHDFDLLFKSETRLGKIFNGFTALAILIACLGLFGLASYTSMQRTKEFSIRKVLGASLPSLLRLLYQDYFKLILIAFVLASVAAYFFMSSWLSNFAYQVGIEVQSFLIALIGALVLTGLTVAYHSIRTASTNPAENLKNE